MPYRAEDVPDDAVLYGHQRAEIKTHFGGLISASCRERDSRKSKTLAISGEPDVTPAQMQEAWDMAMERIQINIQAKQAERAAAKAKPAAKPKPAPKLKPTAKTRPEEGECGQQVNGCERGEARDKEA